MNHRGRPDLELKIYPMVSDYHTQMRIFRDLRDSKGLVLHLAENIHGNVFNRPFPHILIRNISSHETLPQDLKDDGDPWKDYFFTVRSVKREKNVSTSGFIFMGFKVLNNDQIEELDRTWKDWTGLRELLSSLDTKYLIKRVHCFKAFNAKPDIFKYGILIEIAGNSDLHARDCLQKFRVRRMSGYVALYEEWNNEDIRRAMESQEKQDMLSFNLEKN